MKDQSRRFKSDYINERPEEFQNPVEFSFDKSSTTCDIEDYSNMAIVKYLWCKKLCLKHFFIESIIIVMSMLDEETR